MGFSSWKKWCWWYEPSMSSPLDGSYVSSTRLFYKVGTPVADTPMHAIAAAPSLINTLITIGQCLIYLSSQSWLEASRPTNLMNVRLRTICYRISSKRTKKTATETDHRHGAGSCRTSWWRQTQPKGHSTQYACRDGDVWLGVDHLILLQRLQAPVGIGGTALDWIRSFLSGRPPQVMYDGEQSPTSTVLFGVPRRTHAQCSGRCWISSSQLRR